MLWMLVRGVVHERDGQSAGACHGGCLASPKHLTQMLFVYRSDRCPALDCAFQPVLECLHQTKHWVFVMAHLTVVSTNPTCPPSVHAAHDLRNIMASIGLHLETLQRLSGPSGAKAADAAYALLTRSVALCNRALDCTTNADNNARRRRVDLVQTARQIADLLAPIAPKEFSFDIGQNSAGCVLADPDDVFRILFNLMNNAVSVARGKANTIKSVTIRVTTEGTVVMMQSATMAQDYRLASSHVCSERNRGDRGRLDAATVLPSHVSSRSETAARLSLPLQPEVPASN
jgi:hypothetical protein